MNIYCKFHNHHKDVLICKLICPRELQCKEFQELCQQKDREIRWLMFQYMLKYPDKPYKISFVPKKGRKPEMKQFICIREGQIQILSEEDLIGKIKNGEFYQTYFEVGREMDLLIKLVPKVDETATKAKPAGGRKKVTDLNE
jgi:hypothetical protein